MLLGKKFAGGVEMVPIIVPGNSVGNETELSELLNGVLLGIEFIEVEKFNGAPRIAGDPIIAGDSMIAGDPMTVGDPMKVDGPITAGDPVTNGEPIEGTLGTIVE